VTLLEEVVPACRPGGRRDGVPDSPFGAKRCRTVSEQSWVQLEVADATEELEDKALRNTSVYYSVTASAPVGVSA